MQKNMDTIQFETRAEVEEVLEAIGKYVKAFPKEKDNQTLKTLYELLDVMDMTW